MRANRDTDDTQKCVNSMKREHARDHRTYYTHCKKKHQAVIDGFDVKYRGPFALGRQIQDVEADVAVQIDVRMPHLHGEWWQDNTHRVQ
jgi:hypothetical protein